MSVLQSWMDQLQDRAVARLMQGAGHLGFFGYRFPADRFTWTPGLCRLFGLEAAPGGGIAQWYTRIREADRARIQRELRTACALQRPHATLDFGIALPDGLERVLSSHVALSYSADGRPWRMSGVTVDATHRRADDVRRAKDELLTALGHRMRTPLGALSSAAEVLQVVEPGSADAEEARAVIERQTLRLAQILNELSPRGEPTPATDLRPLAAGDTVPPSRPRKVLVVEDNCDALASLRWKLEEDGHEVSTAADGFEGLCRLRILRPEVSIVDIGVPRLTGLDLARHARASGYAGRMIALSGVSAGHDFQHARTAGFDACLVKPVERSQLRSSLAADRAPSVTPWPTH
ncbi:MAG: response regulator [Ramlibacter sp.]|nr:response regulator [Ramlibacter sp.]